MAGEHTYEVTVRWTGNRGEGTRSYTGYGRDHEVEAVGKPVILGSADPAFRGDATRFNPEELLVASLSQCHMLWYLHLCAQAGVIVVDYIDSARGTLRLGPDGRGAFSEVVLAPRVTVTTAEAADIAWGLHRRAYELCFIANSVSFPVRHEPQVTVAGD